MIEHPDINESQRLLEPVGQSLVGGAGRRLSGRMVVRKNDRGRVMGKGFLDHFPGMDGAAVDGAVEELFEGEGAVAGVEEEGDKDFSLFTSQLGDQVAFGMFGVGEGFLTEEPPLELPADEFEDLVDRHRTEEAVFAPAVGGLEGRALKRRKRGSGGGRGGESERELRRFARLPGKCDALGLLPGFEEEVFWKEGEVAFQPVAGSKQRLLEPGQRLPQGLAVLRIGGIEGGEDLPDGLGCGGEAFAGQWNGEKEKEREGKLSGSWRIGRP